MVDRVDTSSAFDNMEVASEIIMHSSSSSPHGSPRNDTIDERGCGSIHQMVSIKRRRVVGHTHDVLDTDEGVVDDLAAAAAQGDGAVASATHASADAFIVRPVVCVNGDLSGIVSQPGNIGDFPPFTSSSMSTSERRRINRRRSFRIANANAAMTAMLSFVLICATSAAATTANEVILGDGVDAPTLDGRFQRRHVTSTTSSARTNLRRSSSFSTAYSKVATPEENSEGRRMADFFTDRKAEPLEFRIENVNSLRPTQSQEESDMAAVGNTQNFLPPLSPTLDKRATIVFHQPTIDSGIHNKATHIPSQPAQTGPASPHQKPPHGGTHWHEAANFGPQIKFTSVGAMIPAAKRTFHAPPTTPTLYSEGREKEVQQIASYQDIEEDYQNFYKQTQEEKDKTAKAREGLLEKLYGSSLERPNNSADIGENSLGNRGPTETFAAGNNSSNGSSSPSYLQGRDNHFSFTLVGNSIAVVVPGEADPIPTEFTVDPLNNNCVVESGCTVFYSTSTNDFVDANGAAVGVAIDIDTIISQNAGSSSSGNNNLGYTLFLDGNNIVVRYQGQDYPTQFTVDSSNCVVQSNNCEYFWDGNGGFVNAQGQSVSVEIDLETIITSSGAGTSTTGGGDATTTTTETVVTEETTTGGNNNGDEGDHDDDDDDDGDDEDEASGPTMEPTLEASDSADEDSAEHSGKGYSSSSGKGKGKGKGSSSKSSKASKGCKSGKSGKSGKGSKSSKSCSSSSSGKGKGKGGSSPSSPSRSHPPPPSPPSRPSGGSHPPPPSPPSSPSKPSPSRPTRPPVSRPTKPSRPTRAPRPSQTPKPTRRPRTRPTPRPTPAEGPTVSPRPTRTEEPTAAPVIRTPKPTFGPTDERCNGITDATRAILIRYEVIPISGLVALTDTESPQWQAYEWLVYDDDRFVCPNDETLVQRYILAVLYFATAGDAWDRCYQGDGECREEEDAEPYLSASSECEWYGSECFADGLIESVTLENNNLMNEMPLEITQIARLLDLNLSNNDLEGTLPKILGDLVDLRTFNVEKNGIEGRLPESMFELERLEVLNLNGNDFSGTINEKVGDLRRLKEAHFGDNGFEGEIPSSLGRLSDLLLLRLQDNDLRGEMPTEICELRDEKLDELWSDCGTPPDPPQVECERDVCCTECFSGRR